MVSIDDDESNPHLEITAMGVIISNAQIILTDLPISISENNAYINNRRTGGRFPSDDLKKFKAEMAQWRLLNARAFPEVNRVISGWVALGFHALIGFRRDRVYTKLGMPKKIDASNYVKIIQDGVAAAIDRDDCHFWRSTGEKAPLKLGDDRQRCTVVLTEAAQKDLAGWHSDLHIV